MKRTWYKKGQPLLDEITASSACPQEVLLWHLGQCGFVLKGASTVYIDAMLNDHCKNGSSARHFAPPFSPAEVRADYVLCTHDHLDHLAPPTIKGIAEADPHTKFIIPAYSLSVLTDLQIPADRILPMHAGQTLALPGLTVTAIATAHPVYQKDDAGNDFSLAYLLEMNGVKILHMGDTYLTDRLMEDLKALPTPDIFIPPINGSDYFRTARNCIGNLNTIEVSALASMLKPDLTIPAHFDMFIGNTVDPLDFVRYFIEENPGCRWHIPTLGERFIYRKSPASDCDA